MNEKISALIDAELNELDERRILEAMKHDATLRCTWERYHLIRSAMTRQLGVLAPSGLADRVRAALDASDPARSASLRFWPLAGGFAAAASVALVAFLGLQAWRVPVAPTTPVATAQTAVAVADKPVAEATQTVAATTAEAVPVRSDGDRLHYYLFGHNEFMPTGAMGNMLPYVRVVSDSPEK